jgi:hypothetical protein
MKLYIISEDGSNYDDKNIIGNKLWEGMIEYLNISGEVICAGGNNNVYDKLLSVLDLLSEHDYIFIAMDNVDCPAVRKFYYRLYQSLLPHSNNKMQKKLMNVYIADYTCVEQIFLFAKNLDMYYNRWLEEQSTNIKKDFTNKSQYAKYCSIRDMVLQNRLTEAINLFCSFVNPNRKRIPNEEHFYAELLSLMTKCNGGAKIENKRLGDCWCYSCDELNLRSDWYDCNKCNNNKRLNSSKDKLMDILLENHLALSSLHKLLISIGDTTHQDDIDSDTLIQPTQTSQMSDSNIPNATDFDFLPKDKT